MSVYASIEGIGDLGDDEAVGAPWIYRGSHILPAADDPRGGAVALAKIPSHITRDGRDDQPEDGTPWPWLRLSLDVASDDPTVILNPDQVRHLRDQFDRWLNQAAATEATALTEVLARLHPYHRVGGGPPLGYQILTPISPADYNRWNAALHPASGDDPPVQCWHTEAGTPCDWNVCHQPERIAAGDYGTDPRERPPT